MGLMDWFKSLARGGDDAAAPTAVPPDEQGAEVAGLNFKTAVDAHMKWKVRLESYIDGTSSEQLQVDVISRDDQCPLGKWIHSTGGERFGFAETFVDMKSSHADFHRCAGLVLATAQNGDRDQAMNLLQRGDYVRYSERVKSQLARLFVIASEGRAAVDSHARWKANLRERLASGHVRDLDPALIARDDGCALGKWLAGAGAQRFGQLPAFAEVKAQHAAFHQSAAKAAALGCQGQTSVALHAIDDGECETASENVVIALQQLFRHVDAAR